MAINSLQRSPACPCSYLTCLVVYPLAAAIPQCLPTPAPDLLPNSRTDGAHIPALVANMALAGISARIKASRITAEAALPPRPTPRFSPPTTSTACLPLRHFALRFCVQVKMGLTFAYFYPNTTTFLRFFHSLHYFFQYRCTDTHQSCVYLFTFHRCHLLLPLTLHVFALCIFRAMDWYAHSSLTYSAAFHASGTPPPTSAHTSWHWTPACRHSKEGTVGWTSMFLRFGCFYDCPPPPLSPRCALTRLLLTRAACAIHSARCKRTPSAHAARCAVACCCLGASYGDSSLPTPT